MSKRLWVLPVLVAMLIALGSGAGTAMPSLGGFTGIVTVPNAYVAPMGQLQAAVSYQRLESSNIIALNMYDESSSAWSLQALSGIAEGAELWAAYSRDNSDFENSTWGVGGKYQIPMEGQTGWNLAVGASYQRLTGDFSFIDAFTMYDVDIDQTIKGINAFLVATGDLTAMGESEWAGGTRVLGTLGLMYKKADGDFSITEDGITLTASGDDSLFRPFVGVEFLGEDATALGLEYRWKDSDLDSKAVFSAVLRHAFEEGFSVEVGTTNADTLGFGTDDQNWFARLGYTFGMQ
jgi:hypothetical protein